MKKLYALLLCLTLLFSLAACSKEPLRHDDVKQQYNVPATEAKTTLTNRQLQILATQGLPADYDELTANQKVTLESIETFLDYLDIKYGVPFKFQEYTPASKTEKEQIKVTTTLNNRVQTVTVARVIKEDKFIYSDNYLNIVATPDYEELMNGYFKTVIDPEYFRLFSDVEKVTGEYDKDEILKNTAGTTVLFIGSSGCGDTEKLEQIIDLFVVWVKNQGLKTDCRVEFCLVDDERLADVSSFNYANVLTADLVKDRVTCLIDRSGSVVIE